MSDIKEVRESIVLSELDFEPPCTACEFGGESTSADWYVLLTCGHDRWWCSTHMALGLQMLEENGGSVWCKKPGCNQVITIASKLYLH